jgi:hypothetical protein
MGLAPYGNPESPQMKDFVRKIKTDLVDIREDGSILLNMDYFGYATGLRMVFEDKWEQLFACPGEERSRTFPRFTWIWLWRFSGDGRDSHEALPDSGQTYQ